MVLHHEARHMLALPGVLPAIVKLSRKGRNQHLQKSGVQTGSQKLLTKDSAGEEERTRGQAAVEA